MTESRKKSKAIMPAIIIVCIGLNIFTLVYFLNRPPSVPQENSPIQISDVTGANRDALVGKTVTVDGYFLMGPDGSAFLTQGQDDVRLNNILNTTSYVHITGTLPQSLAGNTTGNRVLVKGIVGIDQANKNVTELSFISGVIVGRPVQNYIDYKATIRWQFPALFRTQKYAVLISGGWDASHAYLRYWNDLKFMYAILVAFYKYNPKNIFVIYKDGIQEDTGMPVNYSCSYSNINAAFSWLNSTMSDVDDLFIYTTNHGGAGNPVVLCLWNHDLMMPSDLASMMPKYYKQIIVVMEQCFSGGFINALSGPRRVIMTAASSTESSYACDTEGPWDEFVYHFMDAVRNMTLLADPVGADTNSNGQVSILEAFNYARATDSCSETPQYDDNGDGLSHSGWMPSGGDGTTGATMYL
jgi:hypothetical protein